VGARTTELEDDHNVFLSAVCQETGQVLYEMGLMKSVLPHVV
jgi:hypothetical protein